jgi:phosphatidate cytidylyltransferase
MLKYRLPSGIIMGLMVIGAIFIDGEGGRALFVIIGGFLAFFSTDEFLAMLEKIGLRSFRFVSSSLAAVLLICAVLQISFAVILAILIFSIAAAWSLLITAEDKKKSIIAVVTSCSVLPLIVIPLYFLALIYVNENYSVSGRLCLFYLLLVTKLGDVGAYTVGTLSARLMPGGNHKIQPRISPKKSWEGTFGGMLSSVLTSLIFCAYVPEIVPEGLGRAPFAVLAGVLLFLGGFIGDLTESALKRGTNIKDSGTIIPGMGGALDVIDSLIINAPLFYLFLLIFRE